MNCHRARMALIERDLELLTLGHERALDEHLAACPACSEIAAREQRLVRDLAALPSRSLVDVDVKLRVMGAISVAAPVDRRWVPARQLGWAAAAAVGTTSAQTASSDAHSWRCRFERVVIGCFPAV